MAELITQRLDRSGFDSWHRHQFDSQLTIPQAVSREQAIETSPVGAGLRSMTPEEERQFDEEAARAWQAEQARLFDDMRKALERYTSFIEVGYEAWQAEWKKRRMIK